MPGDVWTGEVKLMSDNKNVNNKEKGFVVGGYTFKTKQEAQCKESGMKFYEYRNL